MDASPSFIDRLHAVKGILAVTGGERKSEQFLLHYPGQGAVLQALRLALDLDRQEVDHERRTGIVHRELDGADGPNANTQFLTQFALDSVEVTLIRFDLAAGKLPQTAMALVDSALADKQTSVLFDN